MTWPLVAQFTTAIPGDGFDGWQNYWNQWWIKVAFVDRIQNPFQTDLLYYPTGVDLYFHTLNPFNGVTTMPIQLSLGLIPAYNAVVYLSWPLAGYGVYLLVSWLLSNSGFTRGAEKLPTTGHLAAFLAGVIFTFAPFHMAHLLGHMQVMSLQWIPFYVLYLLRGVEQAKAGMPWLRSASLAGLFLTWTGLCDWYFVLYLFFFTGLFLVWTLVSLRIENGNRLSLMRWIAAGFPAVVAGAIMLLLLSPILIPMVQAATQFSFMVRPTSDLYILSATVLDFFIPNRLHTLFRPDSFSWPGNQIAPVSERTIAIGYFALGLSLMAIVRGYRASRFWSVSALFFFLLALGPQWHWSNLTAASVPEIGAERVGWTPFALLNEQIPFMRISRSVSRYALMVQFSVAVLAGLGAAHLLRAIHHARDSHTIQNQSAKLGRTGVAAIVATTLLAGVLFESWVVPFPMSPPDTPAFYDELSTMVESDAILNLPMNYDRPGYLLYQTVHQKPLTVAYISRDDPRTLTERVPLLQHFRHLKADILDLDPTSVGATVLNDLGIGLVIQDRYKMPSGLEREYTEALANAIFADQPPLYVDERITVHEVQPVVSPQPYIVLGALHWGPLTIAANGTSYRVPAQQGALLHLYHTASTAKLQLRYHTLPDVTLSLWRADAGQQLTILPPAPDGTIATLPLDRLMPDVDATVNEPISMLLQPGVPDGVWIEQVGLIP